MSPLLAGLALLIFVSPNGFAAELRRGKFECLADGQARPMRIELGSKTLVNPDAQIEKKPMTGHLTRRKIEGFDSKGWSLFGGWTYYVEAFGWNETYAGNGIKDGEVVVALRNRGNQALEMIMLSTGEEGELEKSDPLICDPASASPATSEDRVERQAARALRAAIGSREVSCTSDLFYAPVPLTFGVREGAKKISIDTGDVQYDESDLYTYVEKGRLFIEMGDDAPHHIATFRLNELQKLAKRGGGKFEGWFFFGDQEIDSGDPLDCRMK
jgi:hypothetical protein